MKGKNGIRTYQSSVAIVTGGGSGIGRAIATELAQRGAAEVVIVDLQTEGAEATARTVRGLGARGTVVTLDVRDAGAIERMVADLFDRAGRVDYVFNNAGTGVMGETHLLEARDWDLTIDVNLRGVVNVVRAAYPRLIAQGFGHLINTASCAGLMATPFLSAYSATKHAVVGLSKAMRIEAARFGVRVSALCPGAVRTPLLSGGAFGRTTYDMTDREKLDWWERLKPADVDPFAKQTLDLVAKNRGIIVLPKGNLLPVRLFQIFPALEEKIVARLHAKTLRDYPVMARASSRATTEMRAEKAAADGRAARAIGVT